MYLIAVWGTPSRGAPPFSNLTYILIPFFFFLNLIFNTRPAQKYGNNQKEANLNFESNLISPTADNARLYSFH
jgi:hypothetical protein